MFTPTTYTVTGIASPAEGGTATCTPSAVNTNGSITCTAAANAGYTFSVFSGECTGTTCSLANIQSNKSVIGTFTAITYVITTAASPVAGGTVSCAPNPVLVGDITSCTATPSTGSKFTTWTGAPCTSSLGSTCVINPVAVGATVTATFETIANYVPTGPIIQIIVDPVTPTTLYAALDGGGVYKKVGAGAWTAATTQPTNLNVKALAIKADSSVLYAGTDGGGVFKSTNAGVDWAACAAQPTNVNIRSLALSGSTLYAGTTAGVFTSTDACATWSALNTGLPL